MKPVRARSSNPTTLKELEKKACAYVQDKYLGSFLRRQQDFVWMAIVALLSVLIGLPLSEELTKAAAKDFYYGCIVAAIAIFAALTLYHAVRIVVRMIRTGARQGLSAMIIDVVAGILTFVFMIAIFVLVIALFDWSVMSTAVAVKKLAASLERQVVVIAALTLMLAFVAVGLRKLLVYEEFLPPELAKSGYFERRRLRTTPGAIQRFLRDRMQESETDCRELSDKILDVLASCLKLTEGHLEYFNDRAREERQTQDAIPDHLKGTLNRVKQLHRWQLEKREKLESKKSGFAEKFKAYQKWIANLLKMFKDKEPVADYELYDSAAKVAPQDIDDYVAQRAFDMLNASIGLKSSLTSLQGEVEELAALADLQVMDIEYLERVDEVITEWLALEVPTLNV